MPKKQQHPAINWATQVCEIQWKYNEKNVREVSSTHCTTSAICAEIFSWFHADHLLSVKEYFSVLFLNRANRVIGWQLISEGGMTGTVADPRIILRAAILAGATGIVLCHNHPSGNMRPSQADKELTDKIKHSARLMDINLLDHIILNGEAQAKGKLDYYSFADEGAL